MVCGGTTAISSNDFVASESVITYTELSNYNFGTVAAAVGKLIQVPVAATSVAIVFNKSGVSSLNLTSDQLCSIFTGKDATGNAFTTWDRINSSFPATPIKVVYRSESSGTSELFTRHLEVVCGTWRFTTNSTFTTAKVGDEPWNWVSARGDAGVRAAIDAADGTIGYVSPDYIQGKPVAGLFNQNETAAARLPAGNGDVLLALSASLVAPTGTNRTDPLKWVPKVPNPVQGYPIVGTTNLILSQCYTTAANISAAFSVLRQFYDSLSTRFPSAQTAISEHQFVALPAAFLADAKATFLTGDGQGLQIGLSTQAQCGGKGR